MKKELTIVLASDVAQVCPCIKWQPKKIGIQFQMLLFSIVALVLTRTSRKVPLTAVTCNNHHVAFQSKVLQMRVNVKPQSRVKRVEKESEANQKKKKKAWFQTIEAGWQQILLSPYMITFKQGLRNLRASRARHAILKQMKPRRNCYKSLKIFNQQMLTI